LTDWTKEGFHDPYAQKGMNPTVVPKTTFPAKETLYQAVPAPHRIPRLHQIFDLVLTISNRIMPWALSFHVKGIVSASDERTLLD
jgi:hypothetical protein